MKLVEKSKTSSSKCIKLESEKYKYFYWQRGYGCFSVNPTKFEAVKAYIKNKGEHHQEVTFQEEYKAFLKKYNIDYDEKHIWD